MTVRTPTFPRTHALALCSFLGLFAGAAGCAGTQPPAPPAIGCSLARSYSEHQVVVMQRMRDDGDGLSQVARVLGGTRADVRCAEKAFRMARSQMSGALAALPRPAGR
jgi:hypothetical protein